MAPETRSAATVSFGVFEVDVRAGELRKQGKRIKMQDQPFQVLSVLLRRPGDVVTREELRSQIWPEGTFVDFDNSLNTAIFYTAQLEDGRGGGRPCVGGDSRGPALARAASATAH
jgi:DNA-binding response OmpR family regulator